MIIDDSWYIKPEGIPERQVAGGLVIRTNQEKLLIALIKEGKGTYYLLPKGGVEAGETIEGGARREIHEEAGIHELKYIREIGKTERLDFRKKNWCIAHYLLFTTNQSEGKPTDLTKDYRLKWFPIDALPLLFWPEQRKLIEENQQTIMKEISYE